MSSGQTLAFGAFVFALAVFVGFLLISKVPTMLHTPLMSGTNFIHGIVLVGALTVAVSAHDSLGYAIAVAAVLLGTLNVVGGWVVTDRMLTMFRRRPAAQELKQEARRSAAPASESEGSAQPPSASGGH
jgi:H+-translocating NAD(P) transhydrogenase subunit alpha